MNEQQLNAIILAAASHHWPVTPGQTTVKDIGRFDGNVYFSDAREFVTLEWVAVSMGQGRGEVPIRMGWIHSEDTLLVEELESNHQVMNVLIDGKAPEDYK